MKKILVAAALCCFTGSALMAQTTAKTGSIKTEVASTTRQKAKPAEASVVKTTTAATADMTKAKHQIKSAAGQAEKVKAAKTSTAPLKKDGTPDKRFKGSKKLKKDGTPDKRFKANQHH